jgi:bacterioferritin-associated ferredoxin
VVSRLFGILNAINYHLPHQPIQPRAMIVCVCRRVNDKAIAQAARCGASFDDIQIDMGVATQCGQCESSARAVWAQCRPLQPVAHLHKQRAGGDAVAAVAV